MRTFLQCLLLLAVAVCCVTVAKIVSFRSQAICGRACSCGCQETGVCGCAAEK